MPFVCRANLESITLPKVTSLLEFLSFFLGCHATPFLLEVKMCVAWDCVTSQKYACVRISILPCIVFLLVVKSDCLVCRLEYTVCNCDHLWNHYGYWWNSVGNMFLHGKVGITCNMANYPKALHFEADGSTPRRSIVTLLFSKRGSYLN